MAALLAVIVALCLCAPLYAHHVAHVDPFRSNLDGTTIVNGKRVPVMVQSTQGLGLGVTPIGPTWDVHHYFLGADEQGRDVAARLLYGGRNSLLIGTSAALITCFLAVLIGVVAGFFGGLVDGILSRFLDLIWAFPVYLLAISLSTVLIARGISFGPFHLTSGSLLLPITIIGARLHPVRRATGARRGAVDQAARVRRGRDRARRVELAAALERRPPERDHDRDRAVPAHARDRHAHRGGAVVPLDRRAGAARRAGARSSSTGRTCCTRGRPSRLHPGSRSRSPCSR